MQIEIRYFASLREALDTGEERTDVPADIATVGELRQWLRARGPVWSEALGEGRALRMALDQVMCRADARLADGCEVAFFPPVTGG